MKHSNQEETSKNQGVASGQNKKANKPREDSHHEPMDPRGTQQNPDHQSGQGGDGSNWPREKQTNKKK